MKLNRLLAQLGIKTLNNIDPQYEASETPIEAMITDMEQRGLLTDQLREFMEPYMDLERMHLALAFDEGAYAAAMNEEELPPKDGIDYFGRVYT